MLKSLFIGKSITITLVKIRRSTVTICQEGRKGANEKILEVKLNGEARRVDYQTLTR